MWIFCEPEEGWKNVLLCLDGSASSLRIVDHVGYILSFATLHNITLFHMGGPLARKSEEIFDEAKAILQKHGISEKRIGRKAVAGLSAATAILTEKKQGNWLH